MGSHSGQQNFPFGYIPNELHGIGLPDFMTPGPPPGQPLLSEHDAQHLDSFLSGFDAGGDRSKDNAVQQIQRNPEPGQEWLMPPTFVGSETSLRPRSGADWQGYQMSDLPYANSMSMATMSHPPEYANGMHGHGFPSNGHYDHNLLNQLHNAAQAVQPSFPAGWQQNFQSQQAAQLQQTPRPMMRFGSDAHFQPDGYAAPDGPFDPATAGPNLDWLEAHSSATNTQPNTAPNTQPSSPNWTKKRKLDEFQSTDHRRNGYHTSVNPHHAQPMSPGSGTPQKKANQNKQDQPLSPRSRGHMAYQQDNEQAIEDDDASYDEDDDPDSQMKSPSPSSSSRARSHKGGAKHPRVRKKSTASVTTTKTKPKAARGSTSGPLTSRVPLTADQKKANHTNSEQRRRDATARAYAELYDLVPELEEMGKQSTMKKLEIVVKKVHKVKERVQQLRGALGFDVDTGLPLQHDTIHPHLNPGTNGMTRGNLPSAMVPWPQ